MPARPMLALALTSHAAEVPQGTIVPRPMLALALTSHALVSAPAVGGYELRIQNQPWEIEGQWRLTRPANGQARLECRAYADTVASVPGMDTEVVLRHNGVVLFAGTLWGMRIHGVGDHGTVAVQADLNVLDYHALASRRVLREVTLAAGTLRAQVQALVAYLPGVSLDPAQVDGPAMPAVTFRATLVSRALEQLAASVGSWMWRVSHTKQLKIYQPGTVSAPFDVTPSTVGDVTIGDVTVEPVRTDYANRVIVLGHGVTGMAEDVGQLNLFGPWELVFEASDATNHAHVDALAAAELARRLPVLRTVTYRTTRIDLEPGQSQVIDLPSRGVSNVYLITETEMVGRGRYVTTQVRAVEGLRVRNDWRAGMSPVGGTITYGASIQGGVVGGAATTRVPYTLATAVESLYSATAGQWVRYPMTVRLDTETIGSTQAQVSGTFRALDPGVTLRARLYDRTASAPCPGESVEIGSTDWTYATWTVTLTPGVHLYSLELLPSVADAGVSAAAYVE